MDSKGKEETLLVIWWPISVALILGQWYWERTNAAQKKIQIEKDVETEE